MAEPTLKPFTGSLDAPQTRTSALSPFDGKLDGEASARSVSDFARDIAATAVKGAISVPETVVGLADIATGGQVGKVLENEGGAVGFRPKQAKVLVNEWHSDATKEAQSKFQAADGIVDKAVTAIQNPSLIATAVGESLPAMGAGGVAARGLLAATKLGQMGTAGAALAGAAGEGVTMAGSAAEQIRQETPDGLLTPTQSGLAAATGVAGAAIGAIGGRVAQKLGIGDAETLLAQGTKGMAKANADDAARAAVNPLVQQQAAKSIPRRVVEGAIAEGFLEELPQSVAEQVFQNVALGKDWLTDVDAAVVMGVLSGYVMGGAAAGYHGMRQPRAGEPGVAPGNVQPAGGEQPGAAVRNPGMDRIQQAFADQLSALQQQEQGEPAVPQTTPPDGAAVLAKQQAQAAAQRQAAMDASRAVQSPDDEIYQSTGATVPRSVAMGLDPAAGPLSASAALAVDSGASDQIQQAAALAQAAEVAQKQGKKPAQSSQKQEQKTATQQGVNPETGEILQDTPIDSWTDAQLSEVFRGAQSREVRMQLAKELGRRRDLREQQELQAELDAEQRASVPGAERADAAFASLTEDAGEVPADLTNPATTEGNRNGPQAAQAQQDRAQPSQVGAAPAVASAASVAQVGASAQRDDVDALRQQLREVEAKIIAAAPTAVGQGGGDIEAAMKNRKVPVTLKAKRRKLVDQLRAAHADEVRTFAPETGTLGIPRAEMPQVPSQSHGGLVRHLNARGIAHETTAVDAGELKPTQAEYSPAKVEAAKDVTGDRAVIVSSDGHVIDGHHQALAAAEEGKPVKAIVLDAPVEQALEAVKNSPSAQGAAQPIPPAIAAPTAKKPRGVLAKKAEAEAKAERISDFGEKIGGARKDQAASKGSKSTQPGRNDERPAWARRFEISQIAKSSRLGEEGRWVVRDARSLDAFKQPRRVGRETYATREDAELAIPLLAVSQKHRVVPVRGEGAGFEIWRNVNERKRVKVVEQVFPSRDAALAYMAINAQAIIETNTTFGEADLPRPPSGERVGAERRTGDARDSDFTDVFGFRGVEFGNWNNQQERQELLNDAYDGLLDLAEVMNVPPRAISLNGELALAFGARGHGLSGARAHYELDKVVINLTKMNGAGSLAHEWFHALDHYFGRQDGKAPAEWVVAKDGTRSLRVHDAPEDDMASGGTRGERSGMRPELREAFADVMRTIARKAEAYVEDTARADRFVATAREEVKRRLDGIRADLARDLDAKYYKRHNKAATAEQLAEFDSVAERIVAGELLELRVESKGSGRAITSGVRWTNDALNRLSAVMKAVRGRQGFSADQDGPLDRLRGLMQNYSARLKMLADAQDSTEKSRAVPTEFILNAKELDQGRGQDYWTRPHELAARAFQGYVEDKIAERGGRSPFLNYGPEAAVIPTPWGFKRPFPAGTERAAINKALDKLVEVIQTRESESGGVALFRREATDGDVQTPGFDVESFLKVMKRPSAYSEAAKRQAIDTVSASVDAIRAAWGPNAPEVVVAFDLQDERIPEAARKADLRQRSGGARGAPEGFYYRGKAYLMASRLNTPNDAARVLYHEVLGHHGLRGKFGGNLDEVLNQIATMRKAEVAAKMQEYGLRGVNSLSVREAAEEVLAEMAEKNPRLPFVQRVISAIRNFLRQHVPGFQSLRLTDSDIIQAYILPARGWVERGARAATSEAEPVFAVSFARHPDFSAAVDAAVKAGTMGAPGGRGHVEIGTLPPALAAAGVPAGDLKTSAKVLQKVVFDHGVPPSVVKRIPELLERPVMVFRSATVEGSFVAVTSEMVRGAPLIVAISPEKVTGGVALNFVPSLYPRDDLQAIQRWLNATKPGEQLLTYLDKEQSPAWFGSTRLQLPGEFRTTQGLQSRSVKTEADAVNGDVGGEALFSRSKLQDIKVSALDQFQQAMSHEGKVSLWDKTVGTMRNLGERSPAFKPVYEAAQRFIDDVSMLGNDAADRAPRLLPRVETLADLKKKPITAADNQAVAKPLFEGTLLWARDVDGTPVTTEALNAKYRNTTPDEKAQILLRTGKIQEQMLKVWRGLPVDQYNTIIINKFDSNILKAGVVWTAKELKELFDLNAQQVSLYQEARAAIDRSIDMTARADMLRALGAGYADLREAVLAQATAEDAMVLITDTLQAEAREFPDQADRVLALNNAVVKSHERAQALMEAGYAPLSRFGRYTVDVVGKDGTREYFGMFESMYESNKMKAAMEKEFPGATVTQGTMSDEAFKLFQGVTPESLEHFGQMLGLSGEGTDPKDKAFQAYLQLAKNNHSALKRLIHRKGISGYSEDVGRVLASFVYSNARLAAGGLNAGTLETAIEAIPKEQGELRDVAMGLRSYIQDPQEEGQAVRGMLFAQYLGGSVASALVNMTQPFQITMPWLSQYGGMRSAASHLAGAVRDMARRSGYEPDLAKALHAAEAEGIVSPQEIHQLMAQARGAGSLRTGDGTKMGDARATAANNWERVKVAWGQPFALAEQFNRRSTFIAAYRMANEQGMADPAKFAERAVLETQFVYSKANKPKWARGAIGGTLFTFKTYSVSYLELMHRMWNQGGPEGKRAVGWAVAMLLLMGGAGGLPFMEDADDLIDGAGQLMGYNISTKQWRKQALRDTVGKELADFVENGVSGLPGAPIDVSGRLGMGNLLPGTGLLLSKQSRERDLLEVVGPAGDLVARSFTGARKLLTGDVGGAALEVLPTAVRNAVKGTDMATSGIYKDTKGYKVIDTTLDEAIAKAIGFQPRSVAEVQESNSFMQRSKSFYVQTSSDIKAQWAQALFSKDDAALKRVRGRVADWNRDNPEQPIVVKMPEVWKRVREMGKDRSQRIADTAPKALRQQMRDMARDDNV